MFYCWLHKSLKIFDETHTHTKISIDLFYLQLIVLGRKYKINKNAFQQDAYHPLIDCIFTTMHTPQPHMPPHNHTCPPTTTHIPLQPCMPLQPHTPAPATMHAPLQPRMPPTSTHTLLQPCMPPPTTMHTPPTQPHNHARTPPPVDRQTPVKT